MRAGSRFDETKHERIVMITGGSGITPMFAMLRYIDDLCIALPTTLI
jgi:ferredoxin-NADP reductase